MLFRSQTLLFESSASDLVNLTFNFNYDLFAFDPYATSPIVSFQIAILTDSQAGRWLIWPALPDKTYHVQFKNSLTDLQWLDASGNVTVVGGAAYFKDLNAAPGQRFYRVMAF